MLIAVIFGIITDRSLYLPEKLRTHYPHGTYYLAVWIFLPYMPYKIIVRPVKFVLQALVSARVAVVIGTKVYDNDIAAAAEIPLGKRFYATPLLEINIGIVIDIPSASLP